MRKSRYNLSQEEYDAKQKSKAELMAKKEKVTLSEEFNGYCDNKDHPLFSIKVTVDKPWSACYYCSKLWVLEGNKDGKKEH
jgi:hypothetical protein